MGAMPIESLRDDRLAKRSAFAETLSTARYLLLVAAPLGALVGVAIAAYDWTVNELLWKHVTAQPLWIQLASPTVAMLLAGLILQLFRVRSSSMADEVVKAYHEPAVGMPTETALAKLFASIATMGFGASAGMEGASKWLGATIGSLLQTGLNKLKINQVRWSVRSTMLTGGSAGIAAIFRAPLSGAIMGVESPYKQDLAHDALLSSLVAAATSFWAFTRLRPATPYFPVTFHYELSSRDLLIAVPLGIAAGLASHLFLGALGGVRNGFARLPIPIVIRNLIGGLALTAIAFAAYEIVGKPVTLQAGLPVANDLLNGRYVFALCLVIFALKLLATAITFGAGGVGGLFVPTATIGAALGACFDAVLAPSHPGVCTLLGIAAFAGASYNSLLFAAVFIAESTGNVFLAAPALIASTFAFIVSAGVSNSRSQKSRRPGLDERLAEVLISDLMIKKVVSVGPAQTLETFSRGVLLEHHHKALPVRDAEGKLLGMIGLRQLGSVPQSEWSMRLIETVMDVKAPSLSPTQNAQELELALARSAYPAIAIVDDEGKLIGVAGLADLHRARGGFAGQT